MNTTKRRDLTHLRVRLNVRGCTDQEYSAAAIEITKHDGYLAEVLHIVRTSTGATVFLRPLGLVQ